MADTARILAWLTRNQHSTAAEIAAATGLDGRYITARLQAAEMAGTAGRDRENGAAPWRWRALKPRRLSDG